MCSDEAATKFATELDKTIAKFINEHPIVLGPSTMVPPSPPVKIILEGKYKYKPEDLILPPKNFSYLGMCLIFKKKKDTEAEFEAVKGMVFSRELNSNDLSEWTSAPNSSTNILYTPTSILLQEGNSLIQECQWSKWISRGDLAWVGAIVPQDLITGKRHSIPCINTPAASLQTLEKFFCQSYDEKFLEDMVNTMSDEIRKVPPHERDYRWWSKFRGAFQQGYSDDLDYTFYRFFSNWYLIDTPYIDVFPHFSGLAENKTFLKNNFDHSATTFDLDTVRKFFNRISSRGYYAGDLDKLLLPSQYQEYENGTGDPEHWFFSDVGYEFLR